MTKLNKTNYVIVTDYNGEIYLDEVYLLGWDHNTDWFATDIDANDIMTPKGNIKRNKHGSIDIDAHISAYVEESNIQYLLQVAKDAKEEDYECTVCKVEKDNDGDWRIIPIENNKEDK